MCAGRQRDKRAPKPDRWSEVSMLSYDFHMTCSGVGGMQENNGKIAVVSNFILNFLRLKKFRETGKYG